MIEYGWLRLRPFQYSARDAYSRLLRPDPDAARAAADTRLSDLAGSMKSKAILGPTANQRDLIPAGYTYFGQFIDHDMTYDTSALADYRGEINPNELLNYRTRPLNLDNIYGEGPGSRDSALYDDDNVSFRLGESDDGTVCDVPLENNALKPSDRRPLAADPRNLENDLVRQVHALFLKLHNIEAASLVGPFSIHDRFAMARRRVTHQYQWLVRHDFLPRVCDPLVYHRIIVEADPFIDWNNRFSIPIEFAQAAFRFGHSMVRSSYALGPSEDPANIVNLLGGKHKTGPLLAKHKINWARFFGEAAELAMPIDTSIIPEFFDLPTEAIETFVRVKRPTETLTLPFRTMKRGAMSNLPSGQKVAAAFREKAIWRGDQAWHDLSKYGLETNTPLWYYILLEAETNAGGARLGPLGSRLVIEVIEGALWANPDSFLRQYGRHWKPEPWETKQGRFNIASLGDLAIVAGLSPHRD